MTGIVGQLYAILRPSGRKRLALVMGLVLFQALLQTVAVFSLAPFLSAAADIARFRQSPPGALFERLFGNGTDERLLLAAALTSLALLVVSNLVSLYAELVRSRYAQSVARQLRGSLLRGLLERKYTYFLGINSSILTKYLIEDVANVSQAIILPFLDILSRLFLVAFLGISLLAFEPVVVLSGIVLIGLYYLVVMRPIRKSAARASNAIMLHVRELYFVVQQVFGGIKPIFASDQREYFIDRVERVSGGWSREVARLPLYSSLPRSGLEIVMFGAIIGWLVALLLTGKDLSSAVPRIGLIAIVVYRLLPSVQLIFANIGALTAARQSLDEVSGVLREQAQGADLASRAPAQAAESLAWREAIRFEAVSYTYPGAALPALAGLDLEIRKGSRVAFVGPTGSGKSTLIDLLLGLLTPTRGTIRVDGEPLDETNLRQWRRTIGYVPQDPFLLDATIAENIAFGLGPDVLDRERVREVARIAQTDDFVEGLSARGIDAVVGERGAKLSGGQRQRLALARALYPRPDTLVLDEATSALDPATEQKVIQALAGTPEPLTIVTVAHRMSTIADYDVVHYLENGRLLFSGRFEDLLREQERFRAFVSHHPG
jgi:ATP-binding cassette, subfamily B, bacterial PglK